MSTKGKNTSSIKSQIYSRILLYKCFEKHVFLLTVGIHKEILHRVASWQGTDVHSGPSIAEAGCGVMQ